MKRHRDMRAGGSRGFKPRVEALEGRLCLSVTATTVALGGGFNQLKIVADDVAPNAVDIADDGAGGVSVTGTGGTLVNGVADDTFAATNVSQILFDGTNGNAVTQGADAVSYNLNNPQTVNQMLTIKLGNGGAGSANVDLDSGIQGKTMIVALTGQAESDSFDVTIGPVTTAGGVGGNFNITMTGGNGANTYNVSTAGSVLVDAKSLLNVAIIGGSDSDFVSGTIDSQVIGKLNYDADGGAGTGDDNAQRFIFEAGSTGKATLKYRNFEAADGGNVSITDGSLGNLQILINQQDHTQKKGRCGSWHDNISWSHNWGGWKATSWASAGKWSQRWR